MTYIHEVPSWPDLVWDTKKLAALLASVRHKQGFLLGQMSSLGFSIKAEASLEVLTEDITKTSAIEGEILDMAQVRSSLARRLGVDIGGLLPVNRSIEGIVDVILDATQHYDQALTEDRLFSWHRALFPTGVTGMHRITVGNWRPPEAGPMQVVSGPLGRETIHFEAPSAERLSHEMKLFFDWFNHAAIDDVLKAGVAHFWFVTIHPFEDGNGRIARAIADMCLSRADNLPERFYSMSANIERDRKNYYDMLERSQKGGLDITAWLEWFLMCLSKALDDAGGTFKKVLRKAHFWQQHNQQGMNERQRKMLNLLLGDFQGKLTSSKYAKLVKCSHDTALRDIQSLIDMDVLMKSDTSGRSTSYRLARNDD